MYSTFRMPINGAPINGVLLLDKPTGMSSHAALKQAQRAVGADKAGHTGTLDPLATGMLPIAFGEATKLCGVGLKGNKCYRVEARLGERTDTLDSEGQVTESREVPDFDLATLERQLDAFRGDIEQIPPMYSALKQGGEALYLKARRGETVQRQPRRVHIHRLSLLAHAERALALELECSSGTYVRTLIDDLGQSLGCGAHVSALRRLWVTPFQHAPMHDLDALKSDGRATALLSTETLAEGLPRIALSDEHAQRFLLGQRLPGQPEMVSPIAVFGLQRLLGLGDVRSGVLHVARLLHLGSS